MLPHLNYNQNVAGWIHTHGNQSGHANYNFSAGDALFMHFLYHGGIRNFPNVSNIYAPGFLVNARGELFRMDPEIINYIDAVPSRLAEFNTMNYPNWRDWHGWQGTPRYFHTNILGTYAHFLGRVW